MTRAREASLRRVLATALEQTAKWVLEPTTVRSDLPSGRPLSYLVAVAIMEDLIPSAPASTAKTVRRPS